MDAFDMRVVRESGNSSLQRMATMVEFANAGKTRMVRTADHWVTRLVLIVMVFLVVPMCAFIQDIYRAIVIKSYSAPAPSFW